MSETRLSEVCEEIVDCLHETAPTQEEGIPSIRTSNIENGRLDLGNADRVSEETYQKWAQRSEPQPGDLILAREAPVGEVGIVPQGTKVCLGQRTVQLRPDRSEVAPRYLLFLFLDQEMQNRMESMAAGSTVAHLNLSDIRELELPELPPLPVQRRIADILGALDDKIELNRRMNETLEEMAQTLYRHWFVDFGPFQDRAFKDTDVMGPIPEGWEVTTVGDTTYINLGQSPKSKFYNEEGDGLAFHQGVSTYGWRFPVHERYCSKKKRVAEDGDILVSVRAPVGRLNIADRKLIIGRGLTALRREDDCQSFLFCFLKEFFDEENKIGSGTVFDSITKSVLNELEMIGPPSDVVQEFESLVSPLDDLIRNNHEENKTLSETRDYLLPKLISGDIEIEAAEEAAEADV